MGKQYQSFPDAHGASKSVAKLHALQLPELAGKAFLDIGCNEGFFCAVARAAGATRVVGIDAKPEYLVRARARFPDIEFRAQSWDDPIEGRFDVILFASAIHYASDQPALIHKLVGLLNPAGVLVLELGIAQESGDQYVGVKRSKGGIKSYATPAALRRVLGELDLREVGPSVDQRGDPVPRFVCHIRPPAPPATTPPRTTVMLFDAASRSGKSAAVNALLQQAAADVLHVSIDGFLYRTDAKLAVEHPRHRRLIETVSAWRAQPATGTDRIMKMLVEHGLLAAWFALLEDAFRLRDQGIAVIDGYLPPAVREPLRLLLDARGYGIWNTAPRVRFRIERLDPPAVSGDPAGAGARELSARLRVLQLPELTGRTVLLIGESDDRLENAARTGGATRVIRAESAEEVLGATPQASVDVLVCTHTADAGLAAFLRPLLALTRDDGMLVVELPADATDSDGARCAAALRRDLADGVLRRVPAAITRADPLGRRVFQLVRLRPVALLFAPIPGMDETQFRTRFVARADSSGQVKVCSAEAVDVSMSPAVRVLLCTGTAAGEPRAVLARRLEAVGYVVWECWPRSAREYRALDVAQVLEKAFPGSVRKAGAKRAPMARARGWRRLVESMRKFRQKIAARWQDRFGRPAPATPRAQSRTAAPALADERMPVLPGMDLEPAVSASGHADATPAMRSGATVSADSGTGTPVIPGAASSAVRGMVRRAELGEEDLVLVGWAADTGTKQGIRRFVLHIGGERVDSFAASYQVRPMLNRRFELPEGTKCGFRIEVPYRVLGGRARIESLAANGVEWVQLGAANGASVEPAWLPRAPAFELVDGASARRRRGAGE